MEVRCKQHSSARIQFLSRSDHKPVIGTIFAMLKRFNKKDTSERFNVELLNCESQRSSYQSELHNQLEQIPDSNDLNIIWGSLKPAIVKAAANTTGYARHKRKPWISNATFELIEQRIKATKCGKNTKDLCREIKRALKKDKGTFLENQAEEIHVADETEQTRKMYHFIRSLDNKSKSLPGTIHSKEGNSITAEKLYRWAEHFKELLSRPLVDPVQPRHCAEQPLARVVTTPPTFVEVKEVQCNPASSRIIYIRASGNRDQFMAPIFFGSDIIFFPPCWPSRDSRPRGVIDHNSRSTLSNDPADFWDIKQTMITCRSRDIKQTMITCRSRRCLY